MTVTWISATLGKPVSDLMTRDVITCTAKDRVSGIMAIMNDRHIRHVPVTNSDDELAGIISIRDIIALRLQEVQTEADTMRSYIVNA